MRRLLLYIPTIRRKSLIEPLQVSEEPSFYTEQIFGKTWQEQTSKSHRLFTCVSESSVLRRMGNVFPIFPTLLSSSLTTLVATLVPLRLLCAPRTPIHYTILYSWALKLSVFKGQVAVEWLFMPCHLNCAFLLFNRTRSICTLWYVSISLPSSPSNLIVLEQVLQMHMKLEL